MRKIKSFLFSLSVIRALFINCVFIKANNNYYVFYIKKRGWAYENSFCKIRKAKMNIQEIYLPSGKQEIQLVRCIDKECNSIMNFHDHSYRVTYSGNLDVNEYVCNCCGKKSWFISDEINDNYYYLNCTRETIGNVYIRNNRFPERKILDVGREAY